MELELNEILSARIRMHVNGHRFLTAYRIDHPGHPEPTEYAVFATDDDYVISVGSGSEPKMGRLFASNDAGALDDARQAVDDFHNVDPAVWERRAVFPTT